MHKNEIILNSLFLVVAAAIGGFLIWHLIESDKREAQFLAMRMSEKEQKEDELQLLRDIEAGAKSRANKTIELPADKQPDTQP